MKTDLTHPMFNNNDAARAHLEKLLWPEGPICPHCGVCDEATLMKGKSHRPGLYNCRACNEPFTVTIGTIFEDSKIPLYKWVLGMHLMAASKKGVSALQLQRMLGLGSYRTAWFMAMRIREALRMEPMERGKMGGKGKVVEADETYIGKVSEPSKVRKDGQPFKADRPGSSKRGGRGPANKRVVVALVERGGSARVFHVGNADKETIDKIVRDNVHPETRLHTDEANVYKGVGKEFAAHETVTHAKDEYVRGDVTTNSVEGFFGVFKRGMKGVYQHCGEKYLARYVTEFEFRHNTRAKLGFNDDDRATLAIKGAAGKRLVLRQPKGILPA
ncbi:MAG: IS1595 family transposase [Alphaproteobacteria bacterium 32-64-14]|nr:MAG: IS1595 family transposase [Alphaproteobacteria bacterium 32-64-14]